MIIISVAGLVTTWASDSRLEGSKAAGMRSSTNRHREGLAVKASSGREQYKAI